MNQNFFIEYGIDVTIQDFILKNQFTTASLACQRESMRWAKKLVESGLGCSVERHGGMYFVNGDSTQAEGHSWLVLDGCVFDPTAGQFKGEIDVANYETHLYAEGDELVADLAEYGHIVTPVGQMTPVGSLG